MIEIKYIEDTLVGNKYKPGSFLIFALRFLAWTWIILRFL